METSECCMQGRRGDITGCTRKAQHTHNWAAAVTDVGRNVDRLLRKKCQLVSKSWEPFFLSSELTACSQHTFVEPSINTPRPTRRCALASFSFGSDKRLEQPSKVKGDVPPALAMRICEPREFVFTATFGSWTVKQCGLKEALATASISIPGQNQVNNKDDSLLIDVTGCPGPLPVVHLSASQVGGGA